MHFYLVFQVLKKNYTRLCQCLPQDYMKTIEKLKQLVKLQDDIVIYLMNLPSADHVNEAVVASLVTGIKSDVDALRYCDLMENLVDNQSSKTDIDLLRKSKS